MKKVLFITSLVSLLFLTNCKKEDSNNPDELKDTVDQTDTTDSEVEIEQQKIASMYCYNSSNEEVFRQITTYDTQDRAIGFEYYNAGVLASKYRNYTYNGLVCTYYIDNYYNGTVNSTNKCVITYTDNTYTKSSSSTTYKPDNTEFYKQSYEYNNNGLEIGYTYTNEGEILQKNRDYVIKSNEITCYIDNYSNGAVSTSQKQKSIYTSSTMKQVSTLIRYNADNTEYSKNEFSYNSSGKLQGISFYLDGVLQSKMRDYVYSGKTQTYFTDSYSNGNVLNSSKYVITYH